MQSVVAPVDQLYDELPLDPHNGITEPKQADEGPVTLAFKGE